MAKARRSQRRALPKPSARLADDPPRLIVRHTGLALACGNGRGVAEAAQWFATEVLRRLSGVRRGTEPGQFYARCPVAGHDDKRASLGIKVGDRVSVIYHCKKGCRPDEIREALLCLGVPEEHLGLYGTPEYEEMRRVRATSEERRELERVRRELAALKNDIRSMLVAESNMARLKVRILSVVNDEDVPTERKGYVVFAMEAGVSSARAYEAWKSDPLVRTQDQCVSGDHVVLTQSDEKRQASQVTGDSRIIEARKSFSNREDQNSRTENSRTEKTGDEAA